MEVTIEKIDQRDDNIDLKFNDWFYLVEKDYEYLCTFAQVGSGKVQLLCLRKDGLNRMSDTIYNYRCDIKVPDEIIEEITHKRVWKIVKVDSFYVETVIK